jgi:hypothetical protein
LRFVDCYRKNQQSFDRRPRNATAGSIPHHYGKVATGYGQRSFVETTMGRYKTLIGPRLRARGFAAQQTEAAIGVAVLNRMLATGRRDSVRREPVIA